MSRNEKKRTIDPAMLEMYLEQPEKYRAIASTGSAGALEPGVEAFVDSLEHWQLDPGLQPRPGFVNEVAQRLHGKGQSSRPARRRLPGFAGFFARRSWGRLLGQGAAVAFTVGSIALFAVWLFSLPRMAERPADEPEAATRPVAIGDMQNPPPAPATLPRYQIEIIPSPGNAEEMLAWAETFGYRDPKRLYREQRNPEDLHVLGEDGSLLSFPDPEYMPGYYTVAYSRNDKTAGDPAGETAPLASSIALAESFLRQHNRLPATYHARDLLSPYFNSEGYPIRQILVSLDLNGYALYGPSRSDSVGSTRLLINAAGVVYASFFAEARFDEGEQIPIRPAAEVVDDFLNGRIEPLELSTMPTMPSGEEAGTTYKGPVPAHKVGERVTVLATDHIRVLIAEDGTDVRITLVTHRGAVYELSARSLMEIAEAVGDDTLRVSGIVTAEIRPGSWRLAVERWEVVPRSTIASGCVVGPVEVTEDGVWITVQAVLGEAEKGARYRIPDAPAELRSGQQIEVCAEPIPEPGGDLLWSYVHTPPRDLDEYNDLQEPSGSHLDIFEQAPSPFEIGETAVLTGFLEARIYQTGDQEQLKVTLFADLPGDGPGHVYPLAGDEAFLKDMAESYYHQYVQVVGSVVEAADNAWGEQAIAVENLRQPWGEQPVMALVGHFTEETIEGEIVYVFVDSESWRRYAMGVAGTPFVHEEMRRTGAVWLAGVVHPARMVGDLPLLTAFEWYTAPDGGTLSVDSYPLNTEPAVVQIVEPEAESEGPEALVVEEIELAYYADMSLFERDEDEPFIATPIWVVRGHSADEGEAFMAYLSAVAGGEVE